MGGLTYDTGALLAAGAGDRRVWRLHRQALERGHAPTVPAAVLAHIWPAPADPSQPSSLSPQLLSGLLAGCVLEALDEDLARACGALLSRTRTGDVIAASVVAGALRRGDLVLTSNPGQLRRLARTVGGDLEMIAVSADG